MAIKQTLSQRSGQSRKGFTLTEAAIVLGIVGLILGAIWVAAAAVYNNLRVNRTNQQLLQIVQTVRSMHATQQTIDTAASTQAWIDAGVFPGDVLNAGKTATINQWNGALLVGGIGTGDSFQILFTNVPRAACVDMLVKNSGQGRDTGLRAIGADGTSTAISATIASTNVTTSYNGMTVTGATGECAAETNSVAFNFALKG